jgi:MFS family permease
MDLPFWLLVGALNAPLGALADHIGRKRVLAAGALTFSATVLGFGYTSNYWLLFFDYVLWAFAMAMRSGADQALVYDSLKAAHQEDRFRWVAGRGFATILVAGLTGMTLGGFVAHATTLAFTVKVSALFPLGAMVVALLMHEPAVPHAERHYWRDLRSGVSFAWTHPQLRYAMLLGSLLMTAVFGPVILMQPFLIKYDIPTALFGVYQAPMRLLSVAAAVVAFRLARRAGVPNIFLGAGAGIVIAYTGLALFDARAAFAFFALPALIQGTIKPTLDNYLNERTPSDRRATVLSVLSLFLSLELAAFEPTVGFITDEISIQAAGAFSALFFLVTIPPLLLLWRRADAASPAPTEATAEVSLAVGGS